MIKINFSLILIALLLQTPVQAKASDVCNAKNIGFDINTTFTEEVFSNDEIKKSISIEDNIFTWGFSLSKIPLDSMLRKTSKNNQSKTMMIYKNFSKVVKDELFMTIENEYLLENNYYVIEANFENTGNYFFFLYFNKYKNTEYLAKLIVIPKDNKYASKPDNDKAINFFKLCSL